ncbi:hypothetical protein WMF18_15315 [Sorangium sp. So ce315]|uniref:hypothetical protein n=1 Tax=Sorangium sp. So ce315 TaxID=3133299 RepID=UPI003F5DF8E7
MKRSGFALGMMMVVGLLPAACGPASPLEGELAGPGLKAMVGKPGSTGPNGIPNRAWHAWKGHVTRVLLSPLLVKGGTINPSIVRTGILEDEGGVQVFSHTVGCAVAEGILVHHDNDPPYEGRGMVAGVNWAKSGLPIDGEEINNVLECVVAFVNDKTQGVSILLTGPNVDDKAEEDHTPYIFPEALWCAQYAGGAVLVDVYPTRWFVDGGCGIDAETALEQRYCYEEGACGLNYKGSLDLAAECEGDEVTGHYTCGGAPCTMTWLKDEPAWCDPPLTSPPPPPPPPLPQ